MTYSVVLIGIGKIGFGYSNESNPNSQGLSHFDAIRRSTRFRLDLCIDINSEACKKIESLYGIETSATVNLMPGANPDLVVIATPVSTHLNLVREVVKKLMPRIILLEKPAAGSLDEIQAILKISLESKIPIVLNYPRRYSKGAVEIKDLILNNEILTPAQGLVRYGRDLLNNGIHFLDLMEFWFGKLAYKEHIFLPAKNLIHNFSNNNIDLHFIENPLLPYSHFSVDILTQSGRLEVGSRDYGFRWNPITPDTFYEGHYVISDESVRYEMGLKDLQSNLLAHLDNWLSGTTTEIYTLEESLNNYRIAFQATKNRVEINE